MRKRNEIRNQFIRKIRSSRKKKFTSQDFKDIITKDAGSVPRIRRITTQLFLMQQSNLLKRVGRGEYSPNRKAMAEVLAA